MCTSCYFQYRSEKVREYAKKRKNDLKAKHFCIDCKKIVNPIIIYPDGEDGPKKIKYTLRCYKCRLKRAEYLRKYKLKSENKTLNSE